MKKLYIIHGWTYSVEPWTETLEILKKNKVEVEMLNVPGLTSPSKRVWTIEEYVNWADENIPDGSIALGHSNGGRILLNLCSEKPEKLKQLILLDSAGVYEKSRKRDLLRKVSKLAAPLKRLPLLRKVFHKLIGASDYDHAPENMKKTLSNMLDSDKSLDLSKVSTKTTILWGEEDTVTPPRQARLLHEKLPNSSLKFFKNWTHAPYISDPEGLANAILEAFK
ncbi:alpha/beta hydrolase [Candidatus Saccharibacteria bacterium]|nr:alpha/beta hydrolase [Candidatus Saccharibacteria bacterium]